VVAGLESPIRKVLFFVQNLDGESVWPGLLFQGPQKWKRNKPAGLRRVCLSGWVWWTWPAGSVVDSAAQQVVDLECVQENIPNFFGECKSDEHDVIWLDQDSFRRVLECSVEINLHCD
jgi:hypothetical protein